jgi:hypothetical protein
MKYSLYLITWLISLSATAWAGPLQKKQVSADAKWLVHLDLENLRGTELGKLIAKNISGIANAQTAVKMDFNAIFQQVSHITAYGDQYEIGPKADGVLLLKMDGEGRKIIEGLLAAQMLADKDESIKKTQDESSVTYSLKDEVFVAIQSDHLAVVSKSRKRIENAKAVLAGNAANLNAGSAFGAFPAAPNSFFFLGLAEAFNQKAAMPPQAKILQMADGGRLVLGERTGNLFVELILKGKSREVIEQIKQVVEGMTALVSLSQIDNPELQQLVRNTKVSAKDNMVQVSIEYPVAQMLERFGSALGGNKDGGNGKKKNKTKKDQAEKAEAEDSSSADKAVKEAKP